MGVAAFPPFEPSSGVLDSWRRGSRFSQGKSICGVNDLNGWPARKQNQAVEHKRVLAPTNDATKQRLPKRFYQKSETHAVAAAVDRWRPVACLPTHRRHKPGRGKLQETSRVFRETRPGGRGSPIRSDQPPVGDLTASTHEIINQVRDPASDRTKTFPKPGLDRHRGCVPPLILADTCC
ncbi:hypothetical protein CGCF415_v003368 [Colletotrichum fructicola]|nr:hypothetical protein CGCFRS4_v001790 [Colletotrichum fructicola]KAF4912851.1 hypothetical protein CGCF415_v003368 [Colletotrichum fructicola]KAF4937493.1 hypothetical protein CGCF245_v005542 [Colletotrichum fructicola]